MIRKIESDDIKEHHKPFNNLQKVLTPIQKKIN